MEGGGEVEGKEVGGVVGHGDGGGGFDVGGAGGEVAEEGEEFLMGLPCAESGAAPVAEVLLIDRGAVEIGGQDFLDLGEAVEPIGEGGAGDVAVHAAVDFVAERRGELGDFAGSAHGKGELSV